MCLVHQIPSTPGLTLVITILMLTMNYISTYCVYEMVDLICIVCYVGNIESNDNTIRKLHTVLRPFMLRRVSNNN
jgi:SNF2 family DNA or RNA helicase